MKETTADTAVDVGVRAQAESRTSPRGRHPFVHRFQTHRSRYILDVNTNRVVCVDPAVWDIADEYGVLERADLARRYADRYTPAEIHSACESIASAQERDGLLLPRGFALAAPPDLPATQNAIAHKRRRITLCATEDCNFRCVSCIYGDAYRLWRNHSQLQMSWEVAQLAIDDYIRHSAECSSPRRRIAFYGGEPLLNFELVRRCVLYARKRLGDAVAFELNTNGSLLSGEAADFLAAEDVSILVSVNGPRHIHDYHRRFADGTATWDIVTRNVREFVARHPKYAEGGMRVPFLAVETMLAPLLNLLELEEFFCFQLSDVLQCNPEVIFSEVRTTDSRYHEALAPEDWDLPGRETLYQRFLAGLADGSVNKDPWGRRWFFERQLFEQPFRLFLTRTTTRRGGPTLDGRSRLDRICTPGGTSAFVSVDGTYYPCVRLPECEAFKLGDVWSGLDAVKSHELKREYLEASGDECGQCWCVNSCQLNCCSEVRDGVTVTAESKRKGCDENREKMHRLLIDLFEILEVNPHAFDYLKGNPRRGRDNPEPDVAAAPRAEGKDTDR